MPSDARIPDVSADKVALFATFARFEFALKEQGFITGDEGQTAWPDWHRFEREPALAGLPRVLASDPDVHELLTHPPMKQIVHNGKPHWTQTFHLPLDTVHELLSAARAVRNTLFHGGGDGDGSRDDVLCRAAKRVLLACLDRHAGLRQSFNRTS